MKSLLKILFVIVLIIAAAYLTDNMGIFSQAQWAINYIKETLAYGVDQVKAAYNTIVNLAM